MTTLISLYDGKTGLKNSEKGQYKIVTNMMLEYWENKKDKGR